MVKSFADIEKAVLACERKFKIVVAGSHDAHVMDAVVQTCEKGLAEAILIGDKTKTEQILKKDCAVDFEFIDMSGDDAIANYACDLVVKGEADIPMKGIISTASFMRAVLNKERGFVPEGALISQATLFEWQGRFMVLSDCAINIAPQYEDKIKIINNAVKLAHKMGVTCPKVAVLAPLETVNPKIESSVHAAMLTMANKRGQIKGCVIDGPLALDNAISADAAWRKGIDSVVAGHADILIVPDLDAGNAFTKALTFFAGLKTAGTVNGTAVPVIMCSRTDSGDDKYHSVLAALMQCIGSVAP
jgi:phosphate butyryltransferase